MNTTILNQKNLTQKAKSFAQSAHINHFFDDGRRYDTHLQTVAKLSEEAASCDRSLDKGILLSVSYLHDTVEDTQISFFDIFSNFGNGIAQAIMALTKDKSLPKPEQIKMSLQKIRKLPKEIWVVKMADRIANLQQTLFLKNDKWSKEYKEYYREESIQILKTLGSSSTYLSQKLEKLISIYNRI